MRKMLPFLLILPLLVAPARAETPEKEPAKEPAGIDRPKCVVLIGWDGAQRNHVKECLGRNELPVLKKLGEEGRLVDIDIREVTDTKAGWSQILTGYRAEVTGVYSNGRFRPIPKGYTVFERLKKQFGADGIVTVAVVGKKAHVDADAPRRELVAAGEVEDPDGAGPEAAKVQEAAPKKKGGKKIVEPGSRIVTEDGKQFREWPGKPYYTAKEAGHEAGLDVWINGLGANDNVGAKALELLEKYKDKPFFFFVHFADVDHQGHKFGENSREYNDALISSDRWTGKIIAKLKALKLYDQTLVCVTADHGFDEGQQSHRNAPYVFLGTNDARVLHGGTRADVAPTILDRFGLDLGKIEPGLDGRSLARPADGKAGEPAPEPAERQRKRGRKNQPKAEEPAPAAQAEPTW